MNVSLTDAGGMLGLTWLAVKDGDERAFALFKRHYSYHEYKDGRRRLGSGYRNKFLIVGPGGKLVLLAPNCDALFVWRKFISRDGQTGINCAVFRNEYAHSGCGKISLGEMADRNTAVYLCQSKSRKIVESGILLQAGRLAHLRQNIKGITHFGKIP